MKFKNLFFVLLLSLQPVLANIKDVPQSHWAYDAVNRVIDQGIMFGDSNGNFVGNKTLTRYEFAKTLARMMEYYEKSANSDHKHIQDMVAIMEIFQTELKGLEDRMNKASEAVEAQNKTINEINELAITLGEEYQSINNDQNGQKLNVESFGNKIEQLEKDVSKLRNKGLLVDTLVKGTFYDLRKIGSATSKAFSATRKNLKQRTQERIKNNNKEINVTQNEEIKTKANQIKEAAQTEKAEEAPEVLEEIQ